MPWKMEKDVIDKTQSEVGFLKEILFKEAHEHVGVVRGSMSAYGSFLDLEVKLGVDGEVVVRMNKASWIRN
jgi:hypothetical protein